MHNTYIHNLKEKGLGVAQVEEHLPSMIKAQNLKVKKNFTHIKYLFKTDQRQNYKMQIYSNSLKTA
jgi:hypothetical protein